MFDDALVEELLEAAARVARMPAALASGDENRAALRSLQRVQDLVDVAMAEHLEVLRDTEGYRDDGAPSLSAWARNELRLDAAEAKARVAASQTMRMLPLVGEAALAGEIRFAHVTRFTAATRSIGLRHVQDAQPWLLDVAKSWNPGKLTEVVRSLRDAIHSDRLDAAWAAGMDKRDVCLDATADGWVLSGFLPIHTGARMKAVLESASVPRSADDPRSASERRLDALDELVARVLEHGLPSDRGVRPQLNVVVDVQTAALQLDSTRSNLDRVRHASEPATPAELTGFGAIGADLLGYLSCGADLTALLTDGVTHGELPQARVLNVGRTRRLASTAQRRAVLLRQRSVCAAPGCTHTHLEIHHSIWYSRGGRTDLDYLVGLCPRCHQLVHAHKLHIRPDGQGGFAFSTTIHKDWRREARRHIATAHQRIGDTARTRRVASVAERPRPLMPLRT